MKTTNIIRSNDNETTAAVIDMLDVSGTMQYRNSQTNAHTLVGDTHMKRKNLFSKIGVIAVIVSLIMVASSPHAFAAGTRAKTTITTAAQAQYHSGAGSDQRTVQSDPVILTVAYKVVINVPGSPNVIDNQVDGVTVQSSFTVTNSGNYDDTFSLPISGTKPGAWTVKLYDGSVAPANEITGPIVINEDNTKTIIANNIFFISEFFKELILPFMRVPKNRK